MAKPHERVARRIKAKLLTCKEESPKWNRDWAKISILEMEAWKINPLVVSSQRLIFSLRFWVWIDWMKKPAVSMKTSVQDLYRRLMAQEARFLACLCDTGKPGEYRLILCCFSCELKNSVQELLSSKFRVCCLAEENSLKPLCREDKYLCPSLKHLLCCKKNNLKTFFWSKCQISRFNFHF